MRYRASRRYHAAANGSLEENYNSAMPYELKKRLFKAEYLESNSLTQEIPLNLITPNASADDVHGIRHGSYDVPWCPTIHATSGCYGNGNEFPCLFRVPAKVAGIPVTSHSILLCVERPEEVIWCYKRGWIMGLMAIRFLQCLGLPDQPWVPFGKKTDDNNNNKNNKPICAFDLLAPVDGELLQDGGDKSSGSSNRSFFVSEIISKPPVVQDSYTSVSVLESSADIDSSGRPSLMLCLEIDYMLCNLLNAKGVEDTISKSTVDMVLVSRNEIEPGMDFSAPGEAQESLINETNIELNPKQGNQEAEQIISDGDKAFPKLNREQAIQEAEQIISDGDKADPELNGEVIKQIVSHFLNGLFTVKLRNALSPSDIICSASWLTCSGLSSMLVSLIKDSCASLGAEKSMPGSISLRLTKTISTVMT
ncbi:hypothetical protein Tco_1376045 [Tanacetum coccineum]